MFKHFVTLRAEETVKKVGRPRSFYTLVLISSICAMLLAGCGDNTSTATTAPTTSANPTATTGSGSSSSNPTATSAPASNGEVVQLKYATWGNPEEQKAHQAAADAFNASHPNIHVTYQNIPTDYETKITTMYAGQQEPDVYLELKTYAPLWATQGKVLNLKPFMDKDPDFSPDQFIPNSVLYSAPDFVYGIKATEETFGIFYNKDLFQAAGVSLPPATADTAWTWDQFVDAAKKLTLDQQGRNAADPNFDAKNIKQYGITFGRWAWFQLFPTADTSFLAKDGSKLTLDDPAVADSIQKLADLINVYHVAPDTTAAKTLPNPAIAMQSKRVAMDLDGQWVQPDLAAAKLNWDVGVMPKIKVPATLLWGEPLVISAHSKHPQEAWEFYKFMMNPQSIVQLYSSGLWMPTRLSWYTQPDLLAKWAGVKPGHTDNYKTAILDMAKNNGVNGEEYFLKNAVDIDATITAALDNVWNGKMSAADALKSASAKANSQFQGVYVAPK